MVPSAKKNIDSAPVNGLAEANATICIDCRGPQGIRPLNKPMIKGVLRLWEASVRSARALILKVKVLSAPVSGKHIANKTRVSAVRWNLKEVCGKPSVRRTEIMYKAYSLDKTADQVKVQMLTKGCE